MSMTEFGLFGAELAGAAAAWQLAERGHTVTVLERTTPANEEGSSHGSARIFRYAYPSPLYTKLVVRAKRGWDALEAASGRQLITPTGAVDFGEVRGPARIARVLEGAGIEHELLSRDAARERFSQIAFDTDVLYHPGAGVLDAITTVETMLELAVRAGNAAVHTNWEVASIERRGGGFDVRSTDGTIVTGAKVIVAAGGWFPHLPADLALPSAFLASYPTLGVRQEQAFAVPWRDVDDDDGGYPS